jgi:Zn-dependent peptidase ImmA (M78 family)
MDKYDSLTNTVETCGVYVIETEEILKYGVDGLWKNTDGEDYIFINPKLTRNQKANVLSEEYGHYLTSVGICMDYKDLNTAKIEQEARLIAAGNIVTLDTITDVLSDESMTLNEVANEADVNPEILSDSFNYFRRIFGEEFLHKGFYFDLRNGIRITRAYSMA